MINQLQHRYMYYRPNNIVTATLQAQLCPLLLPFDTLHMASGTRTSQQ